MTAVARAIHYQPPVWDEAFLEWFARQPGIELFEFERRIGGFHYYQFVSRFKDQTGLSCSSFGRSQDRIIAAVKCAAECIERKAMMDFFSSGHQSIPKELHTSNGWAVQRSAQDATSAATHEALERHLLLKSFLRKGWSGFDLVNRIKHEEIELFFLRAIYQADDTSAGLVVAKSPQFTGVSIGQCAGLATQLESFRFWEAAVYESIDRILTLNGQLIEPPTDSKSWILGRSKELLETPFELSNLTENSEREIEPTPRMKVEAFNLSEKSGTELPLFAAFAHGPSVLPLFPSIDVRPETEAYLRKILASNGLDDLSFPKRHPIL